MIDLTKVVMEIWSTWRRWWWKYDRDDEGGDDDVADDIGDDDDGYPAYSHQSYSHQVGICHNDEGWEYDTVKFPPYPCIMISIVMRGVVCVVRRDKWNPSGTLQTPHRHPQTPFSYPPRNCQQWQNLDFDLEACLKVYFVRLVQTPLKSLNLPQFEATISLRISKFSFGK